jgi:hypothetical protein
MGRRMTAMAMTIDEAIHCLPVRTWAQMTVHEFEVEIVQTARRVEGNPEGCIPERLVAAGVVIGASWISPQMWRNNVEAYWRQHCQPRTEEWMEVCTCDGFPGDFCMLQVSLVGGQVYFVARGRDGDGGDSEIFRVKARPIPDDEATAASYGRGLIVERRVNAGEG